MRTAYNPMCKAVVLPGSILFPAAQQELYYKEENGYDE